MFTECKNPKQQGNIGEARAIYEFAKRNWLVSKPVFESPKYDLVVEVDGVLKKVQVKTSKSRTQSGNYEVQLRTCGGNQSFHTAKKRTVGDYDYLFVMCENGDAYLIPESDMGGAGASLTMGKKFEQHKL
jgi:hypothetical protein